MLNIVGKGSLKRNQTKHVQKPNANKPNCPLLQLVHMLQSQNTPQTLTNWSLKPYTKDIPLTEALLINQVESANGWSIKQGFTFFT